MILTKLFKIRENAIKNLKANIKAYYDTCYFCKLYGIKHSLDEADLVSEVLEYQVKPIIGNYVKQHEALYNAFYNAFSDFKNDQSFKMSGTKNILMQPEFDNTNRIREIIGKDRVYFS